MSFRQTVTDIRLPGKIPAQDCDHTLRPEFPFGLRIKHLPKAIAIHQQGRGESFAQHLDNLDLIDTDSDQEKEPERSGMFPTVALKGLPKPGFAEPQVSHVVRSPACHQDQKRLSTKPAW